MRRRHGLVAKGFASEQLDFSKNERQQLKLRAARVGTLELAVSRCRARRIEATYRGTEAIPGLKIGDNVANYLPGR